MNVFQKFFSSVSTTIGKINWTTTRVMKPAEFDDIRQHLKDNYFVILTRHNGHLSAYAISFAHWFLTGRWGYYGHVLMNLEDGVNDDSDYRFIEATGEGVHYADFNSVFDQQCSSVALLKPKGITLEEWTAALDKAKTELGKPYDTLFDLANDKALSCVELVRVALQSEPHYATAFANFEQMIKASKNLDPHTFYECADFVSQYEVRH
jgi:hypothetical protein